MGFGDLFKKKTEEELFQEAVAKKDTLKILEIGKKLLAKNKLSPQMLNPYINALIRVGKEKEAIGVLNKYGEEKLKNGYFSSAIAFLQKSFRYDPANITTAKLLSKAYEKKHLYFEAFNTLIELFKNLYHKGEKINDAKILLEQFLEKNAHPAFHKIYAETLLELGLKDEAYKNFFLAGGMYSSLNNYEEALSSFLKAKELKESEIIDHKLAEVSARLELPSKRRKILKNLILSNQENLDFLQTVIKNFIESKHINDIDTVVEELKNPKLKWTIQALRNIEAGEIEDAIENIENVRKIDESLAEKLKGRLLVKYPEAAEFVFSIEKSSEEIPSADDILSSVFSIVDEQLSETEETIPTFSTSTVIKNEDIATVSKQLEGPIHKISLAEAMLGLGKLKEAEKLAKEALEYPQTRFRAISILSSIYNLSGKPTEALNILLDALNNYSFSPEEEKSIKEAIGKLYEEMGEINKATFWYKEAEKVK